MLFHETSAIPDVPVDAGLIFVCSGGNVEFASESVVVSFEVVDESNPLSIDDLSSIGL